MAETTMATQIFPNASHFGIRDSVFINNTSTLTSDPTHQIASHPPPIPPNSLPNSDVSSEWEDDQFPSRLVESEVYARLLLPRRKGYPLWKPKPDEYLSEEYRRVGVDIGDVGYLNESGGFDYLFNACLPANHPVNLGRVPLDFQPLHGMLNPRDLTGSMREHEPGSHIPSHPSHICKTRKCISCTIPRVPHQMGAGFNFSSSTSKGALLILPEGGRKTDHQQLNTFRDYAAKHARSWYAHANGPLARSIPNGSIYFVTGCDKARAWGTACFIDAQPGDVSLEYVPAESTKRGGLPEYWFSTSNSALSLSGTDDVFENQSGCVFLRGFKVAIKIPPFRTAVAVETTVTDISFLEADDLLPKPKSTGFAISPAPSWWLKPYLVPRTPPPDVVSQEHVVPPELNGNEVDYSSSIRGSVYHPSDTINQWILSQNEEVDVSITHDNDWISVIEDGEEMPDDREIIRRIAKNFEVAKCGHYAFVIPQIDPQIISIASPPAPPHLDLQTNLSTPLHFARPEEHRQRVRDLHTLPPELLENIAFYYICPRILGPPISFTPLLLTSKSLYRNLTNAKHLYARVYKYKFSFSAIRRRGFEPGAGEWASQLQSWCKVLRSVRRRRRRPAQEQYVDEVCSDIGMEEPDVQETMYTLWLMCLEDDGCNRLQMQISGVYEWVEGYIHKEMYKVLNKGWPIANVANSCAMWILWYLSSKDRLMEESQVQRESLIELVLPFLTVPFRYPGAFAPANHFRLPFNASASPPFSEPTITAHGPYPIYTHPSSHTWELCHFDHLIRLSTPLAADAAKLVYFSRRETMPFPVPEAFPRNREEHRERVRALVAAENEAAGGQGQVSEYELDMMLQNDLPRPTQDDFLELNEGLLGGVMVDGSGSTRSSPYKCKGGGTGLPCAHDRWDEVRRVLPTLLDSPSFVESDLDEAERILFADESRRGCIDESTCQSRRWDADWWRLRSCRSCWVNRTGLDDAADRDEGEKRGTTSEEVEDIAGEDDSEDEGDEVGDEEEGGMDQNNLAVTEQVQDGKMNDYDADTDTDIEMNNAGIHDSYDNDTERSPTLFTGYPQKGALYEPGALNGLWMGRMVVPNESELRALLLPPAPTDPPQDEPLPPVNLPNGPAPNMPTVPPPPGDQNPTPSPPPPAAAAPSAPAPANANPAAVAPEIGHRPDTFTEHTLGIVAVPLYVRLKEYAVYNGGKVVPCAADTDIIAGEDDDDLDANLSFGSGPGSSSLSTSSSSSSTSSDSGGTGTQGQEWSGGPGPGYPISQETFDQGIADAWFPQFSTISTSASAGAKSGGGGGGTDKLIVSVPVQSLPPRVRGGRGKRKGVGVEEYEYVAVDEEAVARAVNANGDADADGSLRIPGMFHDRKTCSGCQAREEALRAARARDETEAEFGHLSDLPPYVPSPSTIPVCNGIRDVIITGTTDARHASAWGKWAWKGRVRKWDGLIGMIREPALDGPLGLPPGGSIEEARKIFFYGTLIGGKNLVGTWRVANHDPKMPAFEGAFTLGRKEEEGEMI